MRRWGSCVDWDDSNPRELPVCEGALATRVVSIETFRVVTVALSAPTWIGGVSGTACASSAGTAGVSVIRASLAPTHSTCVTINRATGAGWTGTPRASALTLTR